MDFLKQLQDQYGSQVAQQLSSRFGIDPEKAEGLLPRMAPFVLGGVQSQMKDPTDAESAKQILETHADESALDDMDGHFERAQQGGSSQDTLSGLFGNQAPAAQQAMANQLGVSSDMIAKILPVLAPIILGAVMSKVKGAGAQDASDPNAPQTGAGGGMDILGSILSQGGGNGGLAGILGSVMGGATGGTGGGLSQKAGCIAAILGGLLKGKR